jgi:hypothetical protein
VSAEHKPHWGDTPGGVFLGILLGIAAVILALAALIAASHL